MSLNRLLALELMMKGLGIDLDQMVQDEPGDRPSLIESVSLMQAVNTLARTGITVPGTHMAEGDIDVTYCGTLSAHHGATIDDTVINYSTRFQDDTWGHWESLSFKISPKMFGHVQEFFGDEFTEGQLVEFTDIDTRNFVHQRDLLKPAKIGLMKMLFNVEDAMIDVGMLIDVVPTVSQPVSILINGVPVSHRRPHQPATLLDQFAEHSVDYLALATLMFLRDQPESVTTVNLTLDEETGLIAFEGE